MPAKAKPETIYCHASDRYDIEVVQNGETGRYFTVFITVKRVNRQEKKIFRGRDARYHAVRYAEKYPARMQKIREEMGESPTRLTQKQAADVGGNFKLTRAQQIEARKLCTELPIIEQRLMHAGLVETARQLNRAVQKIGYELAKRVQTK